ncbi:MAG TPA: flagellar hook capping FlgD N-terminal domain-containing protein [Gemmatimonadales bacterium]|nr:flagellar hook capping FlgD N-terminal domain-containing protein [Gemmatimonadales bacterium]
MTAPVTQGPIGPAQPSTPAPAPTGTGSSAMGEQQFLQLLITQLKNQDPMNPSSPDQFASELAQFSSLEAMQNIQTILQNQSATSQLSTLALKADLGASFIGRRVLAAGNQIELPQDGPASATVDIGPGGGDTVITVTDASGAQVLKQDLGYVGTGRQVLKLGNLPAGTYSYSVTTTAASGSAVPVTTYTTGVVDGVAFQNGTVILQAGSLSIPIDNAVEVEQASTGAAALAAASRARITHN